jgi:hypothetical protein
MSKRMFWWVASLVISVAAPAAETRRPNFIILIADDVSYNDVGCYGSASARTRPQPLQRRMRRQPMSCMSS